jgi:DNA-binding phage protein
VVNVTKFDAAEHLYRSFSENGNPTLKTFMAVLNAQHVKLDAASRQTVELDTEPSP